jgi:hypothetical protein
MNEKDLYELKELKKHEGLLGCLFALLFIIILLSYVFVTIF